MKAKLGTPKNESNVRTAGIRADSNYDKIRATRPVGFVFSGHDVAHCHAHVVPLHDKDDITSRRYFASGDVRYAKRKFLAPFELAQACEKLCHALLHS